jgi:hypothetical protein
MAPVRNERGRALDKLGDVPSLFGDGTVSRLSRKLSEN